MLHCTASTALRSFLEFQKSIMKLKTVIQPEYKAKLNWQAKSWMKKERLPRKVAVVPEVWAFFPRLSSALSHPLPQLRDRTVSIPTHSHTKHHYLKEYVVMEREANTNAASMAKQRRAAPTLELDSTGLSLLCTTVQVILPCLKPHPDSEAGTSGVRLALYARKE